MPEFVLALQKPPKILSYQSLLSDLCDIRFGSDVHVPYHFLVTCLRCLVDASLPVKHVTVEIYTAVGKYLFHKSTRHEIDRNSLSRRLIDRDYTCRAPFRSLLDSFAEDC